MQFSKQYKGDMESVDNHGWSALFHAASAGHQQATCLLLQFGANVHIKFVQIKVNLRVHITVYFFVIQLKITQAPVKKCKFKLSI